MRNECKIDKSYVFRIATKILPAMAPLIFSLQMNFIQHLHIDIHMPKVAFYNITELNKKFLILSCCIEFSYGLPLLVHQNYQGNYQVWQSLGVITVPLGPQWGAFQVAMGVRLRPLRA